MTDAAKATNVIEALARVMRDLPGIGKDQQASAQQGGYAYRGIEQITLHTQGLFAEHGVVFTPHVLSYEVRDLVINNKPWTDVYELVEYTVYGPGGIEDRIKVGPILAIGRDNSDKGGNKCLTQAFKYALIQALTISDAKDDGDGVTHEADARTEPAEPNPKAAPLAARLAVLPADAQSKILGWFNSPVEEWASLSDKALDRLADQLAKAEAKAKDDEPGDVDLPADPGSSVGADVVKRLTDRLDALPDVLRHACEDALAAGFDDRFPNDMLPADVPEASALIGDFEGQVEEPSATGLAARAAKHAVKS